MLRKCHATLLVYNARSFCTPTHSLFPYGISMFEKIRKQNKFFVDNTRFIPLLEQEGENLFLTRPPRFGKSLFLNTLQSYYDVKTTKDKFDELFGGLSVHQNPTDLQGRYHILKLDFSVEISTKSNLEIGVGEITNKLHNRITSCILYMCEKYGLPYDECIKGGDALDSLYRLSCYCNHNDINLMILIDEYDRFANKLMAENIVLYKKMVRGKSGDAISSPIRSFFETLKSISSESLNFRSFTVGITPLTLADASGVNFMKDVSLDENYGNIVGFTQSDIDFGLILAGVDKRYKNIYSCDAEIYTEWLLFYWY